MLPNNTAIIFKINFKCRSRKRELDDCERDRETQSSDLCRMIYVLCDEEKVIFSDLSVID